MGGGGSKGNRVTATGEYASPMPQSQVPGRNVDVLEKEVKKLRTQLSAANDKYLEMRRENLRRATFSQQDRSSSKKRAHKKKVEVDIEGSLLAISQQRDHELFRTFKPNTEGLISSESVLNALRRQGLLSSDIRLVDCFEELRLKAELSFEDFRSIKNDNLLMDRALKNQLVIPEFVKFRNGIKECYIDTKHNEGGGVATYIPSLARINPDQYGVAVCTVDGQRANIGDSKFAFCIQSSSKPLTYGMACELHGVDKVHKHVGREPSGRNFNSRVMLQTSEGNGTDAHGNAKTKSIPHNPCINAGAIMCASLVKAEETEDARFDYVISQWEKLAGRHRVGFQNGTYMGERATADRNFCLGYMMCEEGAFPENTDLIRTLESYFMYCSIELTAESMAVVAASLANGGVCPITGERVFQSDTVKHILSIMQSCGMYDYSGEFAFTVGFPSKSGVSGVLCIVIPGVVGISTFSPRLDELGNSVRGLDFCKALNKKFNFHQFSSLRGCSDPRLDITKSKDDHHEDDNNVTHLWFAAASGNVMRLRQLAARGVNVTIADYDRRSALHLAASSGHAEAVEFLISIGAKLDYEDRFKSKAIDDAVREKHQDVEQILKSAKQQKQVRFLPMPVGDLVATLEAQGFDCTAGYLADQIQGIGSNFDLIEFEKTEPEPKTISKAVKGQTVVNNFPKFKQNLEHIYGRVASSEIPHGSKPNELFADGDDNRQALGVCTVDGQRCSFGDSSTLIPLEELVRPVLYCQGMAQLGLEEYHKYVGREPSPSDATEVELNPHGQPFNPMTTSGAILGSALVDGNLTAREKMKRMQGLLARLMGGEEAVADSKQCEKHLDACNKESCVSYMMKDSECMSKEVNVQENLNAYFRHCTLSATVSALSVFAATLANGGVCPTTNERVFAAQDVKNCLSLMYSAGMDNISGTFQFEVGVPARCAMTGATLVIVPNIGGFCYFHSSLDQHSGAGVRSLTFAHELVNTFSFHQHDRTAMHGSKDLQDPTMYDGNDQNLLINDLLTAASVGDLMAIKNLHSLGVSLDSADYDLRTAAHIAAAQNEVSVLRFLAEEGASLEAKDRWGGKPMDDAQKEGHKKAAEMLQRWISGETIDVMTVEEVSDDSKLPPINSPKVMTVSPEN